MTTCAEPITPRLLERTAALVDTVVRGAGDEAARELERLFPAAAALELVAGEAGRSAGILLRGKNEAFTRRADAALRDAGVSAGTAAYYRALAQHMRHAGGVKFEWSNGASSSTLNRSVAFYFCGKKLLREATRFLEMNGVERGVCEEILDLCAGLGVRRTHFLAAGSSLRGRLVHKLYIDLSGADPHPPPGLPRALRRLGAGPPAIERLLAGCRRLGVPGGRRHLFLSFSFSSREILPGAKLDFRRVPPAAASQFADDSVREDVRLEGRLLCRIAGTRSLSYLGVRVSPEPGVWLKYYLVLWPPARRRARETGSPA